MSTFISYVVNMLSAAISVSIVWLLLSKLVKKTPRFIGTTFKRKNTVNFIINWHRGNGYGRKVFTNYCYDI